MGVTLQGGNRVLIHDQPASVVRIQGKIAFILLDTQRPSSLPKPVPVSLLVFVSKA